MHTPILVLKGKKGERRSVNLNSVGKIAAKTERLLEFDRNWLCISLRDSDLYSPLKVLLEPLYDPKHELWLGEECRFMVTHGLRHILNVFRYATRLYYDTVHNRENPNRNKDFLKEDIDKVFLIVSIWLHDWGMAGPEIPDYLKSMLPEERGERFLKMLNETLEVAGEKLGERFNKIRELRYDCQWIRSIHSLITYFNITKASQSINLDVLGQKLENYDRDLEDIAVICLFHRFSLAKLKEFGKEHLSGLSALLAFLDGCDENWQRLSSMEHVQRIMARSVRRGDETYQRIDSAIHFENLRLMGIDEETSKNLGDAWDKGKFAELLGLLDSLLNTSKNREKLASLREDVEDYKNNFVNQFDEHIEPKLLIKDVYFKNGEIILVPRHKLVSEENPAIEKTVEKIRGHLRDSREGLEKLGLRFTEENIRLWKPKDGPPENLEIPEITSPDSQHARDLLNLIKQGEGQCLEFKSTFRVDLDDPTIKPEYVEERVVKAICGFMNRREGGTLLIGVGDDGEPLGLQSDYESLSCNTKLKGRDKFEQKLRQALSSRAGKLSDLSVFPMDVSFIEVQGKDVCKVDVRQAHKPVWVKEKDQEIFYVRSGNTTKPLSGREASDYIFNIWKPPGSHEVPEPQPISPIEESINFREISLPDDLYEITTNDRFLEKPLKQGEWKSQKKENVITFDEEMIGNAFKKLSFHDIMLITGPPNVGKSTFLLFFLEEYLRKATVERDTVIFLDRFVGREKLDSVLENIDSFVRSKYGLKNVLLVIDGLRQSETDEHYVNKCIKLFERASHRGYKLIATLRDSEKEFLKNKLGLPERERNEWAKFKLAETRIAYKTQELESILIKRLNYYREKIKLTDISFKDMNRIFFAQEVPVGKKEQYRKFKGCMQSVVRKSEGLAGYIAFLIEDISQHDKVFSEKIIEKYPYGMVNLVLNTIQRDYYVQKDELIPLSMILLTHLQFPLEFSLTKPFFDSFKTWGTKILDEKLGKDDKEKVRDKINNLIDFYTIPTTFGHKTKFRLLNYWTDAIDEAIHKEKYDKNYVEVVDGLKEAEDSWKYWISDYISYTKSELKKRRFRPDMLYLVGDLAKLGFITDLNVLDFATEFFKEKQEDYATTLSSQLNSLKVTLCFLWRRKAQDSFEKSDYDLAIDSYKKALDLAIEDYTLDWAIGKCYEKMGQEWEALDWYIKSAKKRDTSQGYRILSALIREQYRKARARYAPANIRLRYLELQQSALMKALDIETIEEMSWGMLADVFRDKGKILAEMKDYNGAIPEIERAIRTYETGMGLLKSSDFASKSWYYSQIGYSYNDLKNIYGQLRKPEFASYLKESMKYFKKAAEIDPDTNRGNLQLAKVMAWEDFYREDPDACRLALAKIKTNELTGEHLIEYHVLCGLDNENRGQFKEALDCLEFAKEKALKLFKSADSMDIAILEEKMRSLIDKIYQHLGSCYEKIEQLKKASESYTMYVNLNAYSRKGIDGKIYAVYGKKLFRIGDYETAHFLVERAKKRNPSDARILSMMALLDEKLGRLEHAIENLENSINLSRSKESEGERILAFITRDKDSLTWLRWKLERNKTIEYVMEEIFNIAYSALIDNQSAPLLSHMWYEVRQLLDEINYEEIEDGLGEFKISALCQSLNLRPENTSAREALRKLVKDATPDGVISKYEASYHHRFAESLKREEKDPLIEVFHRLFSAAINTSHVVHLIRIGKIKDEKRVRMQRLSREWGTTGRMLTQNLEGASFHRMAIKCLELSVEIDPENAGSWHNLGWEYFYNGDFDKASEAFKRNLEIEEKAEKKYSHRSKIGLGKIEEARKKPILAAELLKDGISLFLDLYAQKDPQKAFNDTMKTVGSIADLGFIDSDINRKVTLFKYALEVNRKALEILQKTESNEIATTEFVAEKTLVLKRQITQLESYLKGLEKAFQLETIKVGKSFDEIILTHLTDLKKHIRCTEEEVEILAFEVNQKPMNYISFKQLFESHFDYKMEKLKSNKYLLLDLLDNILGACMKKATRDSPFEISAKVFEFCQAYCRELYGEEGLRDFINVFNERITSSFSKIVLGVEYKLGPIESESELTLLVGEFESNFAKLGARVPSIDEINEAVRMRKRGRKF